MKYVYILESLDSQHFYVGITDDLRARLAKHNAGEVPQRRSTDLGDYASMLRSATKRRLAFEKYLKSASGRAFAKKHF